MNAIKIPDNSGAFIRLCVWSVQIKDSSDGGRCINACDNLLFKSSLGFYMKLDADNCGVKCDSNHMNDRIVWNVCRSDIPFIPNWCKTRPHISAAYLTPSMDRQRQQVSEERKCM